MMERPFTPETLADRWDCSAETVRQLVKAGRLRGFRVGRMFMRNGAGTLRGSRHTCDTRCS